MSLPVRRRVAALGALVAGVFVAITLLPGAPTGVVGRAVGGMLWNVLGAGALVLPLLGATFALATLGRLGTLDQRRAVILVGALALLVPCGIGVVARITPEALAPAWPERILAARLTGLLPGFIAHTLTGLVGVVGAALVGVVGAAGVMWLALAGRGGEGGPADERAGGLAAGEAEAAGPPPVKRSGDVAGAVGRAVPAPETDDDEDAADADVIAVIAPFTPPKRKAPARAPAKAAARAAAAPAPAADDLPPITLLDPPKPVEADQGAAQLEKLGVSLLETLRTFKVDGTIAGRTTGPVVTQYEVVPAPGVKAQRIVALADDLAMAMRAPSIRVAPIPGKGAVGVEVPNPKPRMVTLRELFESPEWADARHALPVALGRDLEGKPVVADLAKMPHLLIAGATGAGKSVAINTIVTSLVYRFTPKELRFLMVDPKMVELSIYNPLPHQRYKVVTRNDDAATLLKWAVHEMQRRYELLQVNGARNLADFNVKVDEGKPLRNPAPPKLTLTEIAKEAPDTPPAPKTDDVYRDGRLPYIVVVIDELADLMMTVQAEVETPLAMLAQKARAIGIHLILATQRPSVNVITGLIKANFPSRIAFRVASKVDSRTILDQNGAEALLGNGDMLFLPPGKSEPMRLQGAFIGTGETERVMDWFAAQREARRAAALAEPEEEDILAVIRAQESDGEGGGGADADGERDALFREAAEVCIQNQGGSTSLLQRRLKIGYGRAARIIDQLHFAGILGPPDGSKPREVLIGFDQLDEYAG
ncbi:MAG: DNA translocase FtsK [Gemmatimonadales bacterium]|nr:DNA translocase FtsK [Gemmatimonadales bacterium]